MLNCVDLFAGAGGFSLAARDAGFCIRLAVENDKHAMATYRANLCTDDNPPKLHEGDISSMSPSDIYAETFPNGEQCDLLLGGPPCQGFSTHRINDAGVEDERNDLIHTYFDFVRTFSPTVFLMENVPGMLWPRHANYLDEFYIHAAQAGYFVFDPVVLDARDLGLKHELSEEELIWPPPNTHGSETACKSHPALKPWKNCSVAFSAAPVDDPNDVHMKHGDELIEAFRQTPPNGGSRTSSGRTLKCHEGHDGHKDVYGRIDSTQPGPTMTTACINPSKGRFVHPVLNHGITVRQAARMQTFPDDFIFEGGLMAAGVQVGNAVPIRLGQAIIEHIKPLILRVREADPVGDVTKKRHAA